MIDTNSLLSLQDVKENYQVPDALMRIMMDPEKRIKLMDALSSSNDLSDDFLYQYFSENQADRSKFMQDYTPLCIRNIVTGIIGERHSILDVCAGIGGLSIDAMRINKNSYFQCMELSESSVSFLLLNMAIRNAQCDIKCEDVLTQEADRRQSD